MLYFLLFFSFFSIVYWIVGMYASRTVTTQADFFLAGRTLRIPALIGTLLATQLGGGVILGTASHAYEFGWYGIFYSVGISVGFVLLGCGIAAKLRSFDISTTAELFELRFGSRFLKQCASFLSIITLTGLFIGQVVASHSLLKGLGLENELVFLLLWGLLLWYTMYGGLPAVVMTDILQVILIIGVFGSLFLWFLLKHNIVVAVASSTVFKAQALSFNELFTYVGMPVLFSLIEQDLAQRFFAARTQAGAVISALIASFIIALFSLIPVVLGMFARVQGIAIGVHDNPLIKVMSVYTSPAVYALVLCALLAAIASTADSLLCAISSNVTQDFFSKMNRKGGELLISRVVTLLVGSVGVIMSYFFHDILEVLIQSYEVLISATCIPIIWCFVTPRQGSSLAAGGAMMGGILGFALIRAYNPWGITPPFVSLLLSALGFGVGMLLEQFYSKEEKGI